MWELDHKEGWVPRNWCLWIVSEKTLGSPLDCKEIKPVNPTRNQSWIFIGGTDSEAEAPILWPPDTKIWLIRTDPEAEKDWRQEEKGTTEDEMVGWHHGLNGQEFEQALGHGEEQGTLACFSPWSGKESNTTEWLSNNNKLSAGPVASLEMRKLSLRRGRKWMWLFQGVREDSVGHEKFILVLWGGWVLRGGGHTKQWVLSLGSSQWCSGPFSLQGNVLIRFLSRDSRRPFPEDAVIDEGVAQILRGAMVTILLLGKREPALRLGLLSFSFYFISTQAQPRAKSVLLDHFPFTSCLFFLNGCPTPTTSPSCQTSHATQRIQPTQACPLFPMSQSDLPI